MKYVLISAIALMKDDGVTIDTVTIDDVTTDDIVQSEEKIFDTIEEALAQVPQDAINLCTKGWDFRDAELVEDSARAYWIYRIEEVV